MIAWPKPKVDGGRRTRPPGHGRTARARATPGTQGRSCGPILSRQIPHEGTNERAQTGSPSDVLRSVPGPCRPVPAPAGIGPVPEGNDIPFGRIPRPLGARVPAPIASSASAFGAPPGSPPHLPSPTGRARRGSVASSTAGQRSGASSRPSRHRMRTRRSRLVGRPRARARRISACSRLACSAGAPLKAFRVSLRTGSAPAGPGWRSVAQVLHHHVPLLHPAPDADDLSATKPPGRLDPLIRDPDQASCDTPCAASERVLKKRAAQSHLSMRRDCVHSTSSPAPLPACCETARPLAIIPRQAGSRSARRSSTRARSASEPARRDRPEAPAARSPSASWTHAQMPLERRPSGLLGIAAAASARAWTRDLQAHRRRGPGAARGSRARRRRRPRPGPFESVNLEQMGAGRHEQPDRELDRGHALDEAQHRSAARAASRYPFDGGPGGEGNERRREVQAGGAGDWPPRTFEVPRGVALCQQREDPVVDRFDGGDEEQAAGLGQGLGRAPG